MTLRTFVWSWLYGSIYMLIIGPVNGFAWPIAGIAGGYLCFDIGRSYRLRSRQLLRSIRDGDADRIPARELRGEYVRWSSASFSMFVLALVCLVLGAVL